MKHLRYMPLEDLLEEAIARVGLMIEDKQDGRVVTAATMPSDRIGGLVQANRAARASSRSAINEGFLRDVAGVYRDHDGHASTQAVAKHFGKSLRTAGLYVRRAREAGVLESRQ